MIRMSCCKSCKRVFEYETPRRTDVRPRCPTCTERACDGCGNADTTARHIVGELRYCFPCYEERALPPIPTEGSPPVCTCVDPSRGVALGGMTCPVHYAERVAWLNRRVTELEEECGRLMRERAVERLAEPAPKKSLGVGWVNDPVAAEFADLGDRAAALRDRCERYLAAIPDVKRDISRLLKKLPAPAGERRRAALRRLATSLVRGGSYAAGAIAGAAAAAWAARSAGLI